MLFMCSIKFLFFLLIPYSLKVENSQLVKGTFAKAKIYIFTNVHDWRLPLSIRWTIRSLLYHLPIKKKTKKNLYNYLFTFLIFINSVSDMLLNFCVARIIIVGLIIYYQIWKIHLYLQYKLHNNFVTWFIAFIWIYMINPTF